MRTRVLVHGKVQGINYRAECRREALRRGLSGWVRNLPDGAVQAVFEGEDAEVDSMVEWCRRGPASARVGNVEVSREAADGAERGFELRR